MSRQAAIVFAFVVGCAAGPSSRKVSECLCVGDASVEDSLTVDQGTDAGCDDRHVLVYPKAGCDVAPVCVDPADTACVHIVCGCDGKIHVDGCEGPRSPFQSRWEGPGGNAGDPCGDAGVDASSDG